ncbi:MAG TPA: Lrp/AsnC family transcriptional regulator [Euryarchaeota archaeon]|nr:Lrp/AsnC family transcriptional regulator [Euryarchaeota archaeon]
MITCYVLINVESKHEEQVFKELYALKEVEGIQEVFGQYDIIIKTSAENITTLRKQVIEKIRGVRGVLHSTTLITAEGGR